MLIKRRQFLQSGTLATASLMLPRFLKAFERPNGVPPGNKVLVVLQLSGGNDGLNTIIPVRNDLYYKARPGLGIDRKQALALDSETGLHPALTACKSFFDEGSLAILNGVGYPNPDRSHFRSMDIWQTASSAGEFNYTGWLGRYLDAQCSGCIRPTQALEMDDTLSLALKGVKEKGLALLDPARLYQMSREPYLRDLLKNHPDDGGGTEQPVEYLYKTLAETVSSADYIYRQSRQRADPSIYPQSELGRRMQTIASLIMSDIDTRVYYVSLGSFDTHVNQQAQQEKLFMEMNEALRAFVMDLKSNHRFDDVLLMTFSEFGRRVSQNASGGTDHGTANNMFLLGGALKQQGILNPMASLSDLDDGDLKYQLDFRNVYATLLKNWLNADDQQILGRPSAYLQFV